MLVAATKIQTQPPGLGSRAQTIGLHLKLDEFARMTKVMQSLGMRPKRVRNCHPYPMYSPRPRCLQILSGTVKHPRSIKAAGEIRVRSKRKFWWNATFRFRKALSETCT